MEPDEVNPLDTGLLTYSDAHQGTFEVFVGKEDFKVDPQPSAELTTTERDEPHPHTHTHTHTYTSVQRRAFRGFRGLPRASPWAQLPRVGAAHRCAMAAPDTLQITYSLCPRVRAHTVADGWSHWSRGWHAPTQSLTFDFSSGRLCQDGYVVDFGDIKKHTRKICKELNEHFICPCSSDVLDIQSTDDQVTWCLPYVSEPACLLARSLVCACARAKGLV